MKIWEIIDPIHNKYDTADILKNDNIVILDNYYDKIVDISNDFYIPYEWIKSEYTKEIVDKISNISDGIINSFPDNDNRWNIKIKKLLDYFQS